jgi:hypothetical protein
MRRGVGRSESFRASVQPLVRETASRGGSISELTAQLRERYGRAYRRTDMLADLRRYRATALANDTHVGASDLANIAVETVATSVATIARTVDHTRVIARAGVAVFALSLLLPTLVSDLARGRGVLVASASELQPAAPLEFSLPNQVAVRPRRLVTPEPTPLPAPPATPAPTAPPTPAPAVLASGGNGALVTASWYGPGFYENRLPCWQWLQRNGLPIQFLPDTWGVAHKTLPCGTMLVLTHGANTITVPVVDRGPYIAGRELDLSPRVKSALGCTDLCTVLMQLK